MLNSYTHNNDIAKLNDFIFRWAAYDGNEGLVRDSLSNGANKHSMDDFAFRFAAKNGHSRIVKLLYGSDMGAEVLAVALYMAREEGHNDVVDFLSEKLREFKD